MWGDGWDMEDLSLWSPDDLRVRDGPKMELSDASSALLLKKGPSVLTKSAAASSLSLNTVAAGSVDETVRGSEEPTSFSRWENAFDFLTDGARAVKAFSRPYPVATVGRPKDIQFDIAKAEFKLTVVVSPDDGPDLERLGDDWEKVATEIYVPLVHYASDKLVARFGEQTCDSTPVGDGTLSKEPSPFASRDVSTIDLLNVGPAASVSDRLFSPAALPLALDVEVSDGRWEVEGQTLRWWYLAPVDGESECEYTITIRRSGGAIKTAEEAQNARSIWDDCCLFLKDCCMLM